jgi:hypothetical protein
MTLPITVYPVPISKSVPQWHLVCDLYPSPQLLRAGYSIFPHRKVDVHDIFERLGVQTTDLRVLEVWEILRIFKIFQVSSDLPEILEILLHVYPKYFGKRDLPTMTNKLTQKGINFRFGTGGLWDIANGGSWAIRLETLRSQIDIEWVYYSSHFFRKSYLYPTAVSGSIYWVLLEPSKKLEVPVCPKDKYPVSLGIEIMDEYDTLVRKLNIQQLSFQAFQNPITDDWIRYFTDTTRPKVF